MPLSPDARRPLLVRLLVRLRDAGRPSDWPTDPRLRDDAGLPPLAARLPALFGARSG